MAYTPEVRLESLLNLNLELVSDDSVLDIEDAVMECSDILAEIAIIEQNITAYEGAKLVKKTKSAKKKVKVATKTMQAKDAKAKKAGGKVVKITKKPAKKVAREGDDPTDNGGTGPLPTTSDTNGLTDTDLDADPTAEVQVTEIVDDGTPEDQVVGTEGADFIVQYEDADIVRLEAEQTAQKGALAEKVKAFFKKIGEFIASIVKRVMEFFQNNSKFFTSNKAAIEKGLKSDVEVTINKPVGKIGENLNTMFGDIMKSINGLKSTASAAKMELRTGGGVKSAASSMASSLDPEYGTEFYILGINPFEDNGRDMLNAKIFEKESKPVKLSGSGWDIGDISKVLIDMKDSWKELQKSYGLIESTIAKAYDAGMMNSLKGISGMHKMITAGFSLYNKARSEAVKIMRAAAKAGGSTDSGEAK